MNTAAAVRRLPFEHHANFYLALDRERPAV
jgi:hypothetical protein